MSDYDESYFLRNHTFVKQKDLLIYWYYFITNNEYWKYIKSLNFLQEDRTTIYENIEKKGDIEFIKPGKIFKILLNEAKKHSLSDTDLLHILLFMKLVCDKCYSVEDFPLLIESDSIVINPLFT
tara:strand:- start:125 stop:496 length:372 start_codon:yes stop_codon:yes gene_type:complete